MKASEVATLLKKCSNIIALYEDMPLEEVLDKIYILSKKSIRKQNTKQIGEVTTEINGKNLSDIVNNEFIEMLSNMDGNELDDYFNKNELLQSKEVLMYIANVLSITNSKRHNVETMKHFIISYFERTRMNNIIKNDRK